MAESIDAVLVDAARFTAAGRPEAAVELLRPLLVTHPDHSEAWCRLAAALLDAGDYQLCLDAAKRAITLGERSWAHRLASLSLAEMGRHDEAVVSAREAARRDPGDWRSLVTLSEVLGPSEPEESLEIALRAVEAAPEVPRVHEVLGGAAARAHDTELARRAYTDALLLDPGNAEVIAKLDELPQAPTRRSVSATGGFARRLANGTGDYVEPAVEPVVIDVRPEAQERAPWTVESEWQDRMSAVWPVQAKPDEVEIEPIIQVVAEPQPETFSVRPGRGDTPGRPLNGTRRPRKRTREIPLADEPGTPGPVVTEPAHPTPPEPARPDFTKPARTGAGEPIAFTRSRRVSLWLILRRSAGWLTVGGFVLLVAGMPLPSPLLVWFALALLLFVTGATAFGYRAIPAAERPTPRELADRVPLIATGAVLLLSGLVMLGVWTLTLAFGVLGTHLLVPALLLGLAASAVSWFGLWRIRVASR
ncbi:tetratricopeptide repeat protein [Actinokineospora diospyrosa]|uniref:Tetratricopeptide repeat-containing protein n=1 Tax=Actinokineospora diospyrosa TaxID=103728 RepID=A0ABT1IAN3_9PSEU|nr:tetratricopeptide repeat protein [Actinokineospora diospyrosa]MCP2269629.1 Tetratricopeptide repeat-containing protein [Actinokineospora diospyrosa]